MSIVVNQTDQAAPAGGPATFVISKAVAPTPGRMLILCTAAAGDGSISSVVDNQTGNTWIRGPHAVDSGGSGNQSIVECWYVPSVQYQSGTYTVTATPSSPGSGANPGSFILEVSGLAGTLDQQGTASDVAAGNTQLTVTATGANSNANSLVVCFFVKPSDFLDFTAGPTSSYTAIAEFNGNSNGVSCVGGYKIVSATETSQAVSPSWATANFAAGVIATFPAFSAPLSGPMPRQIYVMP